MVHVQHSAALQRTLLLGLIQRPLPEGLTSLAVVPVGDAIVCAELLDGIVLSEGPGTVDVDLDEAVVDQETGQSVLVNDGDDSDYDEVSSLPASIYRHDMSHSPVRVPWVLLHRRP